MKNVIVPMQNIVLVRRVLLELKEKFIKNSNKYTANIDVFCELEVHDKDGKLVSYRKFKSKSFVANFLAYLRDLFIYQAGAGLPSGVSGTALLNTSGVASNPLQFITPANQSWNDIVTGTGYGVSVSIYVLSPMAMMAQANDDSYGIQIGTGTTSPTASDTALTSKIPNSSMTYSAMQVDSGLTNVSSNNVVFKLTRTFTNNTANTINVSEAGIVAKIFAHNTSTGANDLEPILMLHDTFTAQAVASGQVLTVRYTISITT